MINHSNAHSKANDVIENWHLQLQMDAITQRQKENVTDAINCGSWALPIIAKYIA